MVRVVTLVFFAFAKFPDGRGELKMTAKRTKATRPLNQDTEKLILGYIARGLTQKEALFLAGNISMSNWQAYRKVHGITQEMLDMIKHKPSMKAKMVVVQDIEEGNPASAKWWLEHKESQEFNTKVEQAVTVTPGLSMEDKEKALREYMQKFLDKEDQGKLEDMTYGQSGRPAIAQSGAAGAEAVDAWEDSQALQEVYDS